MKLEAQGVFRGRRVAVLAGGPSSERSVSFDTGRAITGGLRERGYEVIEVDPGPHLPAQLVEARAEVVFNALHGAYGEDGRVQGLLDWMGLPYTGEGLRASQVAFDKELTKLLLRRAGVPVAPDVFLSPQEAVAEDLILPFDAPYVVKPVAQGSSVGVTVVRSAHERAEALVLAARYGRVMVEPYVEGPELTVACLGDHPLGSVEIEPARGFYDFTAKYAAGSGTRYHLPARLSESDRAHLETLAQAAARALGCRAVTRVDFRWGAGHPIVLELNTLPGMTATSLVPKVAAAAGLSFAELCECILDRAQCGIGAAA